MKKSAFLLASIVTLATSLTVGAAGAEGTVGAREASDVDRIVYSSRKCRGMEDYGSEECTFEIFTISLGGGEPQPLLSTFGTDDIYPTYSPDGSLIAFNSWDKVLGSDSHVWVMNADGTDPRIASTRPMSWDESVGWTPDGEIAFTRWTLNVRGIAEDRGNVFLLTPAGEVWSEQPLVTRPGGEYAPAFSPDGRHVAYSYSAGEDADGYGLPNDIWVSKSDGRGPHVQLTRTSNLDENWPAWSPDGKRIAYFRGEDKSIWKQAGWGQIWVMNADGSNKRRLTPVGALDVTPAWSPDGKRIAFTRCHPSAYQYDCAIAVVSLADPDRVRIVADRKGYMDIHPSWQPNA